MIFNRTGRNILSQIHKCSVLQFGRKGKHFKSATALLEAKYLCMRCFWGI